MAVKKIVRKVSVRGIRLNRIAVGARVREMREKSGKTAIQFATELGLDNQTLSRLENGKALIPKPLVTILKKRGIDEALLTSAAMNIVNIKGRKRRPVMGRRTVVRGKKVSGSFKNHPSYSIPGESTQEDIDVRHVGDGIIEIVIRHRVPALANIIARKQ